MTEEFIVEVKEKEEPVRMAPQDIPWPKDKLPKVHAVITEEMMLGGFSSLTLRPRPDSLGTTVLDVSPEFDDEAKAKKYMSWLWAALKEGEVLFVRQEFPAKPPKRANAGKIEGYKHYTK